jgi:hypothetical protein
VAGPDRSFAFIRFVALIHSGGLICFELKDCLCALDRMKAPDRLYALNGPETGEATRAC